MNTKKPMNKPSLVAKLGLSAALLVFSSPLLSAAAQATTYAEALETFKQGPAAAPTALENVWNRTELYFGTQKPDGSAVTLRDFQHFIDKHVTPRFPAGLTLLTGSGQWQEDDGDIIRERSLVLVLLYPADATDAEAKIQAIRHAYKRSFAQESVLRVDSLERVSF